MGSTKIRSKHPLAVRWFHWVNFPILMLMIWSGTQIYWANDIYKITIGQTVLFHFYPESFYELFNIPYHLAKGMAWHFTFMWLFALNGVLYVLYTIISGQWKYLVPRKGSFREAWQVLLHDLGIRKIKPVTGKFNGAQQIAYTSVILMGIGSLLTGIAIYKPIQFSGLTALLGGYQSARLIHFVLTIGYVLFFIIHVVQVIRAGWNNFRAMIAGFEVVKKRKTSEN